MSASRTIKQLRKRRCRECGVAQGQLHVLGCWDEACAQCGGQAVFTVAVRCIAHGMNEAAEIVRRERQHQFVLVAEIAVERRRCETCFRGRVEAVQKRMLVEHHRQVSGELGHVSLLR